LLLLTGAASAAAVQPLQEVQTFAAPGGADQMAYSAQYGLLFLRNSGSAVRVIDTATQAQIDLRMSTDKFTDLSLSPSGRYLFAADFGGEVTGYGTPIRPSHVHRYDLATRVWEVATAPKIAYRLEAVDDQRVLLLESDQWVDLTLNRYSGGTMSELARTSADYYGDIAFDPRTGRVFHGNSGSSSQEINVLRVSGDSLLHAEGTGTYGSASGYGGSVVLSSDGENFYYGRLQVEALDVTKTRRAMAETVYAASADIAFGSTKYFDAHSGAQLGTLGYTTTVYAVSAGGQEVWAMAPTGAVLHHYAVPEPSIATLLGAAGLAFAAFVWRRRKRAVEA
jgi:hypothetical protein